MELKVGTLKWLPERHTGGKTRQNPRWDRVVSGSPGSQKDQGVAEIPTIGDGKPVAYSEPRHWLSCSVLPCTANHSKVGLGDWSPKRGPGRGRASVRALSLPREERLRCVLQESKKLGDSKWDCMPEINMLSHRLGEQSADGNQGDKSD